MRRKMELTLAKENYGKDIRRGDIRQLASQRLCVRKTSQKEGKKTDEKRKKYGRCGRPVEKAWTDRKTSVLTEENGPGEIS